MTGLALAGVAADEKFVVVADRDLTDSNDIFRGLSAQTGDQVWVVEYPAAGDLDYGNSPRATPLIYEDKVYLLGAMGHLRCVGLEDGLELWKKDLLVEFQAQPLTWGACSSPLIVDGKLIVNPGGKEAALAALDPDTGDVVWKTPGNPAAYSSFIAATLGGANQLVGYDQKSLGGWDVTTGKRLWTLVPKEKGDFNVPTPLAVGDKLLVSSENNGTRLYRFNNDGTIVAEPVARNKDLSPDSSTPVVFGNRVFGCWDDFLCLDLADGLKTVYRGREYAFADYASVIAAGDRVLVTSIQGELLLVDAGVKDYRLLGRLKPFDDGSEVRSHPAVVGKRLYIRGSASLKCVALE